MVLDGKKSGMNGKERKESGRKREILAYLEMEKQKWKLKGEWKVSWDGKSERGNEIVAVMVREKGREGKRV